MQDLFIPTGIQHVDDLIATAMAVGVIMCRDTVSAATKAELLAVANDAINTLTGVHPTQPKSKGWF
jgi:hypothetical protein